MIGVLAILFAILVRRPIQTPGYPLDFACLTIAGIPLEELGLDPEPTE